MSPATQSVVYKYPEYYALGYRWNTEEEVAFIQACLKKHGPANAVRSLDSPANGGVARDRPERAKRVEGRLLDIGCGSGRHMVQLAKKGYQLTGVDTAPEMVAHVKDVAQREGLSIDASVNDLRHLTIPGTFDAAFCFMDTFRFLLTNEQIKAHFRSVAERLVPGGLYLLDFWVPRQWDQVGNEIHQWEQTEGDTTVRVFYLQHPDTIDPISQTFEDELVFEIKEGEETREIRGGRTRTRLILPQEFAALVETSGAFELLGTHGEFDLESEFNQESLSWRMISVLKRR